jgi:hypothetical protein
MSQHEPSILVVLLHGSLCQLDTHTRPKCLGHTMTGVSLLPQGLAFVARLERSLLANYNAFLQRDNTRVSLVASWHMKARCQRGAYFELLGEIVSSFRSRAAHAGAYTAVSVGKYLGPRVARI